MRGLKFTTKMTTMEGKLVALLVSAWIEIKPAVPACEQSWKVALLVSAWIEIMMLRF